MDDAELQAIRAARLQELQKNAGQKGGEEQPLNAALGQVLEPSARERLSRVNMVRPDRARAVEQYIMRLVQSGQVRQKIQEDDIVQILNGLARDEAKRNETKIVFSRRDKSSSYTASQADNEDEDEDDFFD
ncbi:Sdd2p [Cyberlindnera jadinii NRRL Y-1542]|uniref:DNA-binding TFAR19-related protein n=1 Tax=Cyberlindnera jadinii (strain ATCC 18201 / CBS 1600 / BCRC 20928 / JCM 3617 / NBRC 0987 / NRRL Y-1542) TaxID=983966 RepID=A0A1E4S9S4_CYBJN|nr:DNA-binding TFAR19-related protein [Cyberlindnera jadinii NRRL Y-1542]ODV76265.1 DNA-binding TFAR19-related protein [Cyberlindnera jadinii NRRL Y-1542]